ncbi:hypothetical protein PT974_03677 [Cladobotryum mycophilum]|uniref:CHAT domain-containing protein n=1 Tax=Cladobotryum mycophilum TaxID=491253 RepID=A0ABR0ST07_9HYPO
MNSKSSDGQAPEQPLELRYEEPDEYALALAEQGQLSSRRYQQTGEEKYLQSAVSYCEEAYRRASKNHPMRHKIMDSLSRRLLERYRRHQDPLDLSNAVILGREAVQTVGSQDPHRSSIINGLSVLLRTSYQAEGKVESLEEAIQLGRDTIALYPEDPRRNLALKTNLATSLTLMYDATNNSKYLAQSVELKREVERLTDDGDPKKPARQCNLGNSIGKWFELTNNIEDLEEALEYNRRAVNHPLAVKDQENWNNMVNCYSVRLLWYFQRIRNRESLDESMRLMQELVKTSTGHPMHIQYVNNLCNRLLERYELDGNPDDLRRATETVENVLPQARKAQNWINRALLLSTLSHASRTRYRATGALKDLEQALSFVNEATEAMPMDSVEYCTVLQDKALTLLTAFERFGRESDLDMAIQCGEESVRSTFRKDRKAVAYSNLATFYGTRWRQCGKHVADLEAAINCGRRSLEMQDDNFQALVNLSVWLKASVELETAEGSVPSTAEEEVIGEAIELAEAAFKIMQATPDHPERSKVAITLVATREARYRNSRGRSEKIYGDRARSKEVLEQMMTADKSLLTDRILIAISLGQIASTESNWDKVYEATAAAVKHLPSLVSGSLDQTDQQHVLLQFPGLAREAAAAALAAGRSPYDALQLLEQGRCLISGGRFERRIDIQRLRSVRSDLAEKVEDLYHILDSDRPQPGHTLQTTESGISLSQRRRAESDLVSLISDIRKDNQTKDFFRYVDPRSLLAGKLTSAVVVINVSVQSHAFLVREESVTSLALPGLEENNTSFRQMVARFAKKMTLRPVPFDIHNELEWLWDTVVGPILEHLGMVESPSEDGQWPRVCWVPTGPLSQLPLHAAGYHNDNSKRTALDRVVSSYSPSIKFLQFAAESEGRLSRRTAMNRRRALIASMASTPKMPRLPHAREEAKAIGRQLQPHVCINEVDTPSSSYLIGELQRCDVFHFSGHGKSDLTDPMKSAIAVADGHVTVGDLVDLNFSLNPPLLAYLSACLTGSTMVDGLVDEGIHLAASFLAAGFQNVIAALWKVGDSDSAMVAHKLYEHVISSSLANSSISMALHLSLRDMRGTRTEDASRGLILKRDMSSAETPAKRLNHSYSWISYIHLGFC